jgi:hypothetical protein
VITIESDSLSDILYPSELSNMYLVLIIRIGHNWCVNILYSRGYGWFSPEAGRRRGAFGKDGHTTGRVVDTRNEDVIVLRHI